MNTSIQKQWELWNSVELEDLDLRDELGLIKEDQKRKEDCFYRELEFGTGGLRGTIGVGTNRMNIYTVAKATQGYASYLNQYFDKPSVAIAYDSRIKSDRFARTAAEVFAANGIRVYIYKELMPTPSLSFAVRHLKCSGGIVITASHNPAKYNGYKVYGSDGCQITDHAAKKIQREIGSVDMFGKVNTCSFSNAIEDGRISYITEDTIAAYIDAVSSQSLCKHETIDKHVSIVYTPLNGAGLMCVTRCLKENGFTNISVVAEQEKPDGNFPTCPYPNPEIREALELGLRDAKRLGSDLLLATDPDCDRVGIAVKSGEEYELLSGNEVGLLLLDYICQRRIALHTMPVHPVMVKTVVTMDMTKKIAENYGVEVVEVLTGFKYIGEQIGRLEACGEEDRFILGFEESYGYLSGGYVRDKDAVNGSLLICEMFAYYKTHNRSLPDVLKGLYETYGYCLNTLKSYEFEGADGFEKMQGIMRELRNCPPAELAGKKVISISDYQLQQTSYSGGNNIKIEGLPKSDVLNYVLEDDISLVIRPSGTEPKLKIYYSVGCKGSEEAAEMERKLAEEIEVFLK